MGNVKNQWGTVTDFFHGAKAEHVHDQIVVTKAAAALAEHDLVVATLAEFLHDVAHLPGAEKLRFLDVHDSASIRHGLDQVCLTCQESRQLNNIANLGHGLALINLMHVGDHWHIKCLLNLSEDLQALVHAGASIGMHRRSIRLIK